MGTLADAPRFLNALRILWSIDIPDLCDAGVIDENWGTPQASERDQLTAFMDAPDREILRMPDANFERLLAFIDSRQPRHDSPSAGQVEEN